jgi:hypothetical protein
MAPLLEPPDVPGVLAAAEAAGLAHVIIGGFAVSANGYVRATDDTDLLVPDGPETDEAILRFLDELRATRQRDGKTLTLADIAGQHHIRVDSPRGVVDVMRGGLAPLDFDTVSAGAMVLEFRGHHVAVANLESIVAFKRLANRPQDRRDLEELKKLYGTLPTVPVPGLDNNVD